ncbi:MAG: tetraacyldisaccharide 4'-kinase [Pseudomonadota bacterium]
MKAPDYFWTPGHPLALLLWPLSRIFAAVSALRRFAYRIGLFSVHRLPVPVVVVGNISVGGAGKTPLVIWLVNHLRDSGWRPGVISRGYGGRGGSGQRQVQADSDPADVGDEPVLIARRTGGPVAVAPRRVAAGQHLLEHTECDILVADDGLQHYALGRDLEIAVVDGRRGLGNGLLLPAGPLREGRWRLDQVDLVVGNGGSGRGHRLRPSLGEPTSLVTGERLPLEKLRGQRVHAVAGVGNPQAFFDMLMDQGIEVVGHAFPDHHAFAAEDILFEDALPVLMTEKDAVKCFPIAAEKHWYLPLRVQPDADFIGRLDRALQRIRRGQETP